jgi:hypothetical protein
MSHAIHKSANKMSNLNIRLFLRSMEWSTPTVRLSIRIKKSHTEPTLRDLKTPSPKQKLKKVSFGSIDIVKFVAMLEESPLAVRYSICGVHSPIPVVRVERARRYSV